MSGAVGTGGTQTAINSGGMGSGGNAAGFGTGGMDGLDGSAGADAGSGGAAGTTGTTGSGGTGGTAGGTTACSSASTLVPGETNETIQVGGATRTYIRHVPASYTAMTPVPLVIDFHPLGGTGAGEKGLSGFAALSDENGFIVLWPDGIDNAWNIGPCCTNSRDVDDLGFAKAMVAATESAGCVDEKRVYATGFSMGGGISHFLACNAADTFAAVTPSSFDLLEEDEEPCHPTRPISVLAFRGTADNVVPYMGGASTPPNGCCPTIHFLGAVGTLGRWAELDNCTDTAGSSDNPMTHMQCSDGVEIGLYTIQGGGHAPGPADMAWEFLKTKSLP